MVSPTANTVKNSWTVTVEEDPETGELALPFPDDLIAKMSWAIGDTLIFEDLKDGSFAIRKKQNDSIHS
jgi:hypothetical protein